MITSLSLNGFKRQAKKIITEKLMDSIIRDNDYLKFKIQYIL